MKVYTRATMPDDFHSHDFVKKHITRMWRITGPFMVQTKEGPLKCEDGWLAKDADGWPYPISVADHEAMYEPV